MATLEQEAEIRWRSWVETHLAGAPDRVDAIMKVVLSGLSQHRTSDDIALSATQAAQVWDDARRPAPAPPRAAPEVASQPAPPPAGGIYDLVSADRSELGRAALAALDAIDLRVRMRPKAFLATHGFRGRYGFRAAPRGIGLFTLLLVVLVVLVAVTNSGIIRRTPLSGPFHQMGGLLINGVGLVLIASLLFVLVLTPILAWRAVVEVRRGRVFITYGLFSTTPIAKEVHWIREATWSQSFIQKLMDEATISLELDTPQRTTEFLYLPGLVPVREAQAYVDKVRNAAQRLRQGQGRYFAGGFMN